MFPNDDICNVDAARGAAHRLFRRYKNSDNKEQPVLGKSQINRLMKATYEAINMPYDPNEEDIFSFMNIFDSNKDGQIQLKDLEAMAVKYLCGEQALTKLALPQQKQKSQLPLIKQQQKDQQSTVNKKIGEQQQKVQSSLKNNIKQEQQLQKNQEKDKVQIKTQIKPRNSMGSYVYKTNVYNPLYSTPSVRSSLNSSKSGYLFRNSAVSTNSDSSIPLKSEHVYKKLTQLQVFQKGKQFFNTVMNQNLKGVTEIQASKLMSFSYELLGRKSFVPSKQDVKTWMKLCDRDKDGIVDLQDYKYFLQRNYERQQRNTKY